MRKKIITLALILIILILIFTGCTDLFVIDDNKTTYQSHPTKIQYTISYGYEVVCTGSGQYNIAYDCDEPEILKGTVLSTSSSNLDYTLKTIATFNTVRSWDIESSETTDYNLGITTTVLAESYIVSDINGKNALTIEEIETLYPGTFSQYTQIQSNDGIAYIDPTNAAIQIVVNSVVDAVEGTNSFTIAKELFKWLKQNTNYQIHLVSSDVQPADVTLSRKTGDCDDLSFLYMSLCRAAGIPSRFIRGFLVEENSAVAHAWVEIFVGGGIGDEGWISVECAGTSSSIDVEVHQNFGLESCEHLRIFKDDGTNESLNASLSGFYSSYYEGRVIDAQSYAEITEYTVLQNNQLVIEDNGNRYYS